jgi:hypothetical protein
MKGVRSRDKEVKGLKALPSVCGVVGIVALVGHSRCFGTPIADTISTAFLPPAFLLHLNI